MQAIIDNIHRAFTCDLERFEKWQSKFKSLDDAVRMASAKIKPDGTPLYKFLLPSPAHSKAFLLAATEKMKRGKESLRQYLVYKCYNEETNNKLLQKLDDINI